MYSFPLEILVTGFGYRLTETMEELTPLQRDYLLKIWVKQHPRQSRIGRH